MDCGRTSVRSKAIRTEHADRRFRSLDVQRVYSFGGFFGVWLLLLLFLGGLGFLDIFNFLRWLLGLL